jgi:hypothetical protein
MAFMLLIVIMLGLTVLGEVILAFFASLVARHMGRKFIEVTWIYGPDGSRHIWAIRFFVRKSFDEEFRSGNKRTARESKRSESQINGQGTSEDDSVRHSAEADRHAANGRWGIEQKPVGGKGSLGRSDAENPKPTKSPADEGRREHETERKSVSATPRRRRPKSFKPLSHEDFKEALIQRALESGFYGELELEEDDSNESKED